MKRIYTLVLSILLLGAVTGLYAQQWTANLEGFSNTGNSFTFSVYLKNTGASSLAFLGGQWAFTFNKAAINTGTLTGIITSSGIGAAYQPKNPTVTTSSTPGRIVFAANLPADGGPCIAVGDSIKIFTAQFTNTTLLSQADLQLAWRTVSPSPTQISYYASSVGNCGGNSGSGVILALTSPHVYIPEPVVPVELSSFTVNTNQRDVNISWTTKTEVSTSVFQIERTLQSTQNWAKVGEVAASGNSNSPKEYSFTDKKLNSGKYIYRLKMVDNDGSYKYSDAVETEVSLPKDYAISQNYPNPFNPTTRIDYQLPFDSKVTLELYGITGEKIATLINGELTAGYYTSEVNASALNLASGVYIYRMVAQNPASQNFVQVKKLMLTK